MPYASAEANRAYYRQYYKDNKGKLLGASNAYYKKLSPEAKKLRAARVYANKLQRSYNLTIAEYDALLKRQNNVCPICKQPFGGVKAVVDHDHETGAVRGLLHGHCNSLLGMARDVPATLENAANYIRENKKWA